jgi:hypothetical protein
LFRSAEGESITNLTQTQKSTTQYIDASITPGKKYTYYVVAVAGTNKSDTVKAEIIPVIPISITTGSVTELAATSAKVSGNVTNTGGGTVTSRGICWSTTPNPTVNNSKTTEGTGAGEFTSILTNLLAGTTYYARAYGENSRGISYGSEITFTTLGAPKLTTTTVSNITATTATSGGTIISDGGSPITAKGVVWSTSPSPTIDLSTKTNDGTGVGTFTSTISNLTNNTKYYFRSYATNFIGTSYGEEQSFTTVNPITELLKQGLVAYYPFNGNANDESGNGNNGTILNGVTTTKDKKGQSNSAYYFNGIDGLNSGISVPLSLPASNYTMSIWFQINDTIKVGQNSSQTIVCVDPYTLFGVAFNHPYAPGKMMSCLGNGKGWFICADKNPNSWDLAIKLQWHNLIILKSATSYKYYIDGNLVRTQEITQDYNIPITKVFLGSYPIASGEVLNGKIDDVRFYNRILTQEEITYLANN